jgi:hypothetical protein
MTIFQAVKPETGVGALDGYCRGLATERMSTQKRVTLMGMVMPVFFMAGVIMVMAPMVVRMVMALMIFPMAVGMRVAMGMVMVVRMAVFVFPMSMVMVVVMTVVMGMGMFVVIQFDFHFFLRFKWDAFPGRKFELSGLFHREAESAGILSIRGTS